MKECVWILVCLLASASAQSDSLWQQYVLGPQAWTVYPKTIVSVSGNVSNADALLTESGTTTFTRTEGQEAPSVVLDFGINIVGLISVNFSGASSGSAGSFPGIRISTSEALQYLGDLSDYTRSNMPGTPIPITPGSEQIAVRPDPYTWTAAWGCQNGTQVCSDGLHGFRYLKIYLDALQSDAPITQAFGTVNVTGINLQYSAFLGTVDTYQGWFVCSDPELTKYWYGAVYTNDIATDIFRETDCDPRGSYNDGLGGKLVLHDGAKRDRDPYIGDVAVSGVTTILSHGNLTSIAVRTILDDLAIHQRDDGYMPSNSVWDYSGLLFDYPMYYIYTMHQYVLYTNDMDILIEHFPKMQRILNEYYPANANNVTKLISRPPGYGDYAFVARDGEASYYNALYVLALKRAAECAVWIGEEDSVDEWLSRADALSAEINKQYWDESVGAYRNSITTSTHPQDANAMAVLAGVASPEQAKSALGYLANVTARPYGNAFLDDDALMGGGSQRVYAFSSSFDLHARYLIEETESAIDQIRRLFGWMYNQDPKYTYWEGVGPEGSMYQAGFTSAAHGWSSGVAAVLTNYVLGITFQAPGGQSWRFDPKVGDEVEWAVGQIQMADGPWIARWGNVNSTITMEMTVPNGTKGSARIPTTKDVHVVHNDQVVWSDGRAFVASVHREDKGNVIVGDIGPGHHVIKAITI